MADILADAREFIGERHERLQAHSDGCWRWHPACMVARLAREVERLRDELESATRHMELAEAAWLRATAGNDPTLSRHTTPMQGSVQGQ